MSESIAEMARRVCRYHDAGYAPHAPTPRQLAGMIVPKREILYGGAAGGGKSDWLLMSALQYVDVPGYASLLLRRTFPQLTKPDSLIPRSHDWLSGTAAEWSEKFSRWTFPSEAILEFGHLQHEKDKFNYQGAAYQFIGFDELTQFAESQYRYLFSRARRPKDTSVALSQVPIRVRAGSNPGGLGHVWVKQRFITERKPERAFLPAKLADNPHLDREEYEATLAELDPVTRRQLLEGDWDAREGGGYFKREWIDLIDDVPAEAKSVRFWDLAATEQKPGSDPDWTVGAKVAKHAGRYYVGPLVRVRVTPQKIDTLMRQTAQMDGQACRVRIEREPGASGKIAESHFIKLLAGFDVRGRPATGSKLVRFGPFASQAEAGNVSFVNGPWVGDCFDELESLPEGTHDDQGDAIAGAFNELAAGGMSVRDSLDMMRSAA